MSRTRQQNVTAAQWSANGGALGASDLTQSESQVYGSNVFGIEEQRSRLPKPVFKKLQATLASGDALDPELADAEVAVVFVGTNGEWETEGRDRRSLALPGRQDELVARVAAANPRTVCSAIASRCAGRSVPLPAPISRRSAPSFPAATTSGRPSSSRSATVSRSIAPPASK